MGWDSRIQTCGGLGAESLLDKARGVPDPAPYSDCLLAMFSTWTEESWDQEDVLTSSPLPSSRFHCSWDP